MSAANPYGALQPWLAEAVEDEFESAMEYWEMDSSQKAKCNASQALEAMYEDDGSNLRIEVYRNVGDKALVQLVEFTQVEDDEPIDAIVSDSEISIKIRFSRDLRGRLEEKRNRSITQGTKGGMIRLKKFGIIVPRFNTSDEDPIHLLLADAEFAGSNGAAIYGHPRPVKMSPKIKGLLKRFHKKKSDDSASEGTPEDSDDEVLSQGEPSEANQSQFGTQAPFSRAPFPQKRGHGARLGLPMIIKNEPVADAWNPVQTKSTDARAVLSLIGQPRRHHVPVDASMPPPARPKIARQHTSSPSSNPKSRSPKKGALQDVAEEENGEVADQVMDVEDIPDPVGLDEESNVANDLGGSEDPIGQPGLGESSASQASGLSGDAQVPKGASNPNNTPTSYQIPVVSSSTVTTTNSSLPSVLPTVEKDRTLQASQKCKVRLFHHSRWNCVLPATRSACKIPENQEHILKKPNSILPSPVGQRFPMGNIPNPILANLSAKAEEDYRRSRVAENNTEVPKDRSVAIEDAPSSPAIADAVMEILSSPPPASTMDIPWSSSPVRTVKRLADLPPDSSLPEERDPGESAVSPQTMATRSSHNPIARIRSSPPHTSPQAKFQDDPMDDESDLETSVPQAFLYAEKDQLSHDRVNNLASSKGDTLNRMSRHVSSSGRPYTHLHLPETPRPLQVTTSSISGVTLPVTQPPRPPPCDAHNISSSAPVISCSYEIADAPQHRTQQVFTYDGSAESRISIPDQEDAMVERQIQSEQASRLSQRQPPASLSPRNRNTTASPTVRRERTLQRRISATEGSYRSKDPPIKREAQSPSPPHEARKRAKKSHSNFHFSQDPPLSQDPSARLHDVRRQFFTNGENLVGPSHGSHRQGSASSASNRAESEVGTSPARSLSARSTKYSVKVKKEPAQEEPNTSSGLQPRQPSTSGMRGLISNDTNSSTSRVNTPVKVKTEVVEEDYQPPSSPMETDAISKPVSPDAMDIDVPLEGQFQDSATGSATAEAQRASAPEDTTHVEETVLLGHSQPPHNETRSIPQTDVGIADCVRTPARSTMPSFAEKKTLPITDPQQIAANDAPVNPPGDLTTPSLAEEKAASTTGPQHVAADDALVDSPGGVDAIQPVPKVDEVGPTDLGQTEPPRKDPGVTKPNDTFDQFCQAYPEYTGNRKHFENLCGQLDSLRRMELGLHPFLWDDYIVRSRRDFKSYTDECADEGTDPLPWSKYYVDAIPGPQFTRGVMNPAMLEKYFAEQGRPLRSAFHPNISRIDPAAERGPPSTFSPFNDSSPRGRDNFRPRGSKRQRRKNAYNQPHGSTSSPLQHNAKQLAPPSTAFPATGPSPATNDGQPPVTSIAHPLPRRPLQAAPAPAPGPSPKPPAATAQQQPPRGPGQNRPPPDPAPSASAASAKKAALASSARPASNKPSSIPTGPRVGAGLTTTGLVKNPKIINNNKNKNNGSGNGTPAPSSTAAAANEKRPNGMPAPPPPVSSAGGGGGNAKGDKPKPKTMFALYKEQRKNRSRPGGSRAGSAVTDR